MLKGLVRFIGLKIVGPFKWSGLKYILSGRPYDLRPVEREYARLMMKKRIYLWVSRRDSHLTTYFISLSDWLLLFWYWLRKGFKGKCPRFGFWAHAFVNISHNVVVEAVGRGVVKSYFDDVFNIDAVAALVPKHLTEKEWDALRPEIEEEIVSHIGKPYDIFFNLKDDNAVSCIELVRLLLKNRVPDYALKFASFEDMIDNKKNITPQMLYDSGDFVVEWEVRK